jgi:DNA-binding FadR family transcriptional regulator
VTNDELAKKLDGLHAAYRYATDSQSANRIREAWEDLAFSNHSQIIAALRGGESRAAKVQRLMQTCAGLTSADLDAVVAMSETFASKSPAPKAKGE